MWYFQTMFFLEILNTKRVKRKNFKLSETLYAFLASTWDIACISSFYLRHCMHFCLLPETLHAFLASVWDIAFISGFYLRNCKHFWFLIITWPTIDLSRHIQWWHALWVLGQILLLFKSQIILGKRDQPTPHWQGGQQRVRTGRGSYGLFVT